MATSVLIFAVSRLPGLAWAALLEKQPLIDVSGTVMAVDELPDHSSDHKPDTILFDLPTISSHLTTLVHSIVPQAGLLFLVDDYDLKLVVELLRGGAAGCLARDASVGELARAIIAAGRGEIVLPPELATQALVALARGQAAHKEAPLPLTEREHEVLGLLAYGLTNKDIAQTLILSVRTVEAHLRNIFGKLGVSSRTEAALWAVNHGYGQDE